MKDWICFTTKQTKLQGNIKICFYKKQKEKRFLFSLKTKKSQRLAI